MLKHHWQQAVANCQQQSLKFALVTVVGVTGSTPREGGSKMVVTESDCFDTIGGGKLELLATQKARQLLLHNQQLQEIHHFPLAAQAQQCCGGSVTVLFEVFPSTAMEVVLFGAGHVGKALVTILAGLDVHITWIDSREDLFPQTLPVSVEKILMDTPENYLSQVPDNAHYIIVTHDHGLDYRLCVEILSDDRFAYLGLIGSETKAQRFRKRLQHDGFDQAAIDKVLCPVGLATVSGKLPMEVAVSIAAQLLSLEPAVKRASRRGLNWQEIKEVFKAEAP